MSTLNYTTYLSQISNLMVITSTDSNFTTMLPGMIDYAEQRIYRELDLLYTRVTDNGTLAASSNGRLVSLPTNTGTYIVVEEVNIITPSTASYSTGGGTRNPVTQVSREFIDLCYPSNLNTSLGGLGGVPEFYAMYNSSQILLGPPPDAAYTFEVVGTQRPTPLSSGNSSTFLTQYCPDLFIAASMVFGSGYMRDFGSQADNPNMSQSWETQYAALVQSADVEQARARGISQGWTARIPTKYNAPIP